VQIGNVDGVKLPDRDDVLNQEARYNHFADSRTGIPIMKEPGLDGRHRDKNPPKAGEIQQKRSDTLNKNLPKPIPQFSPNATLGTMRERTGKVSEEAVRRAAAKLKK
jgi:hypothetical protein